MIPRTTMPKLLLPFALSALLLPSTLPAQESQPSTDSKPAEAQPAPAPEKKPDAFQYFFGKKRDEKKAPEAQKVPEARKPAPVQKAPEAKPAAPAPQKAPDAVPEPVVEPAVPAPATASEVRPDPAMVAQPQLAEPAKPEEPKADAFHYFFGQGSQPAPEAKKEETTAPRKPVDAFDYFFGKDGKADEVEEPQSPPPV
jgi:hypothetical protein